MTQTKTKGEKVRRKSVKGKTFCEFFAGIGLVRAGLEGSGWSCIYANDIAPKKRQLYEARFGASEHFHLGDVGNTDEVTARIGEQPFLATASFPCIDLSLAGHYRGFDGAHSSTFFGFVDVMKALGSRRPKIVMVENVAGFLTARKGEDFKSAVIALAELGYWLDVFLLDACYFTPQSRPRVFVVGMDANTRPSGQNGQNGQNGWLFPGLEPSPLRPESTIRVMTSLELPTGWVHLNLPDPPNLTCKLADVIDQDEGQEWWEQAEVDRHYRMMSDLHRPKVDRLLSSGERWVGTIFRRIRQSTMRAEVRFDGLAGCLRTPSGGSAKQIVIMTDRGKLRMRWMSPREYARLQGAGDFPLAGNKIQQLWGFADAVCVPAIAWIDTHILTPLFESVSSPRRNGHAGQPHS